MSIVSAFAVIALFLYICVGIYVLRINSSHLMNRIFFLECLSLAVWTLSAVVIYSSLSRGEVILWYKISSFGFGLYYALVLHMYLLFTRADLSRLKITAVYSPALAIIAATWFSYTLFEDFIYTGEEWKFIPALSHKGFYAYIVYYISYVGITILLLIRWQKHSESAKEKFQSKIISFSYIFTVLLCTTTDFILPSFSWYKLPALAPVLLIINTSAIVYVMHKYKFLSPLKDFFDSDIIISHNDITILIDKSRRIVTANRFFCEYFLCTRDEASGRLLDEMFIADDTFRDDMLRVANGEKVSCRGVLKYNYDLNSAAFNAECTRVTDRFNDYMGTLIVFDIISGFDIASNTSGMHGDVIMGHLPEGMMKMTGDWGIDITWRRMLYEPWPIDESGEYRIPNEIEIDAAYAISGEAVKETLLYFEESGGESRYLVELLNNHSLSGEYHISRVDLLDESRWYTNEYYFYFIMFTKKIIGRYDFHYGEGMTDQLSVYHKIYEYGFIVNNPFNGENKGAKNSVPAAMVKYYSQKGFDFSEYIKWADSILRNAGGLKYKNIYEVENCWLSTEYVFNLYEFIKILTNNNSFYKLINDSFNNYSIQSVSFLPEKFVMKGLVFLLNSTTQTYKSVIRIKKNKIDCNISVSKNFNKTQLDKYYNSFFYSVNWGVVAGYQNLIRIVYDLESNPKYVLHSFNIEDFSFSCTVEDKKNNNLFLHIFVIDVIAAVILFVNNALWITVSFVVLLSAFNYLLVKYKNSLKNITKVNTLENNLSRLNEDNKQKIEDLESVSQDLVREKLSLEKTVLSRTRELSLANEKLSELDRIKSNFFANISHEIRTPLTLILAPVEAVLYEDHNYKPDKAFFESIHNNGMRLLDLINNLLDFSRLDAGHAELSVQSFDILKMANNYVEAIRSACELKGVDIACSFKTAEFYLYGDPYRIEKIIANLFSNAVKFTESGGKISVSIYDEQSGGLDYCVMQIADTGIGIPADKLESIFDRFSQVDSGSTRKYEGTGIGLALVKEYVVLHDSTISVESRYIGDFPDNHGSVFTVKIPAGREHFDGRGDVKFREDNPPAMPFGENRSLKIIRTDMEMKNEDVYSSASSPDEAGKPVFTILVVEDNPGMHNLLNEILNPHYNVISADNGKEALALIESGEFIPDLILADVMMPEMDGYELTEQIKLNSDLEGVPVILLTAKAAPEMKIEGFSKGAVDYILKPFSIKELLLRIKAQLDLKMLRDKLLKANKILYADLEKKVKPDPSVSESAEIKIKQVIEFIDRNFNADISREGLAAAVDMNPDHLSRMFNRYTGTRLDSHINGLRISRAKQELSETDKAIITIAMDAGFENLRTFNRLFRESEALTPKEFREKEKLKKLSN